MPSTHGYSDHIQTVRLLLRGPGSRFIDISQDLLKWSDHKNAQIEFFKEFYSIILGLMDNADMKFRQYLSHQFTSL